ncbi:[FeFe] hydrogenase H-cluster radical SAM maturase HydG [Ancylomarina euxinus]|uniref:[FeFe] hydrogenase H-cluster radical SAM maturase HydG n=1 Tax=Ancylomarina euxinus TaxID=2283627 RepID=A0A425Y5K8_9BACT|nr:[FeFe] hydrogenase H-cluster radical SAM maturase HydG [Ancylomarina euxinus]MCZ4694253.1 [FeFe] hydrogenase H-cluster radical SAM maturase HydG [Ancylomarina euxinus]MUP14416.1 [FeFe] hydrogenase H-cluster radical SAM maturase HydG [Ancylomarina euxinus]RRG23725.1 [FeFe] hydrogenase H-cluster radical SAM maturase HydG [Ancylomarina euxinus]
MKMIYKPQEYRIKDERMKPFIDESEIWEILDTAQPTKENVRAVIQKSLAKNRLSMQETALLLKTEDPELIEEIKAGARTLKEKVYGDRIVIFAPLYVGNKCVNNCTYCGFRASNKKQKRTTLNEVQLRSEVKSLEDNGQKRLILVYGEHPMYDAEFIADSVRTVYSVKSGSGEIRRVNINAAPLDIEGFEKVKEAAIGTYQIFQETYHREAYAKYHLSGQKSDFDWRLTGLDRAQEALIDDVGIGALFGLYDWKYEVLGLLRHVNHFEACYNVGPHTISFPRIKAASDSTIDPAYEVSDDDFIRLVAILRLAVPYTGLILTARETKELREEVIKLGVSQIDAGTNIQLGGYSEKNHEEQKLDHEQFEIGDTRSLGEVIDELLDKQYLPSFCTACYRKGRTGEHFMEFSVPGFIKRFCTQNAILTLAEYLEDYATPNQKEKGYKLIDIKIEELNKKDSLKVAPLLERLEKVKAGERDLYF